MFTVRCCEVKANDNNGTGNKSYYDFLGARQHPVLPRGPVAVNTVHNANNSSYYDHGIVDKRASALRR
jgi:hypothetical protein